MAFQKRRVEGSEEEEEYLFIGYYRMLLDKGSDQVLGFKPSKNIKHTLLNEKLRDVAECWEFSTNARTFCSYKDPWNRVELSFKAPRSKGLDGFIKIGDKIIGGPVVLNHFEPRYFKFKDYLANDENGFYNFGSLTQDIVDDMCDDIGINRININNAEAPYLAQDEAVKLMGNWEKVCKWIYSTNLDNVASQGSYKKIPVGLVTYVPDGRFYVLQDSDYVPATEDFDESGETIYFKIESVTEKDPITGEDIVRDNYVNAYATKEEWIYEPNKFYILTSGVYSLCQDTVFDSSKTYYEFESLEKEDIAKIADLLIAPAETYNSDTIYYTYNSDAEVNPGKPTGAVVEKGKISEEEFLRGIYYVPAPKRFGDEASIEYHYDTKEYRTEKFMNELTKHFDPEYLATYFIMTEIFECYDSRGKNCMMASWGPQKEGGEYIWYPIFYDIDTQLGINNTGIPSFEFNVDATEAGNYSTSDSVLWNNFYKMFKGSYILEKYRHLRGSKSDLYGTMETPLVDANNLEKWYTFNPEITKNIANKGKRPLIATNLDLYWKYITITNPASLDQNVAFIPGIDGTYTYDQEGTYYYALQGDRSQSRRQFLTSRIEYLDSWLNQGNYSRGGNNRIRGRISANSISKDTTSDKWVEKLPATPYWKNNIEFGEKTHDFDGEYWATLKPIQSTYVTAADDSGTYPSQKYDGVNPVKFKLNDIETGIRQSEDYPEQLVYLYGMNQMSDFGDLNKLYWREFYMEGNADHLTRLQLGYDGYSKTDPDVQWFNKELNGITLTKMPLLKEANFSRIGLKNSTTLDLTDSEKLENFRAVGTSNLVGVEFADGVALNTVYLPQSVTSLKLVKANLLTNLIESSIAPTPINEEDGTVTPPTQGLFLEGFFGNSFGSSLRSVHFDGGSLGYGSYKILKRYLDIVKNNPAGSYKFKITMNDVNWSPYQKLTEGTIYDENETYYEDDKHYGFKVWQKNASTFENLVLNGKLYILKEDVSNIIGNDFVTDVQNNLRNTVIFSDASSSAANPIISGIVYVNNDEEHAIEESDIRNKLQPLYPNLTFFFAHVNKAYSAEFLYRDNETGIDKYVPFKNGLEEDSIQKISKGDFEKDRTIWFEDPFEKYKPEKTHYDFVGWSANPNANPEENMQDIITEGNWSGEIEEDKYDYVYYAIFKIHEYDIIFYDGDGSELETIKVPYGSQSTPLPNKVPYKDDSQLNELYTYSIIGYTDNPLTNKLIDLSTTMVRNNTHYYPVFKEINVYDNFYYIDNMDSYFSFIEKEYIDQYTFRPQISGYYLDFKKDEKGGKINMEFRGKITLPAVRNGKPIIGISQNLFENQLGITHIFFQNKIKPEDEVGSYKHELRQIGASAFYDCVNLKVFEWTDKLQQIDDNAFFGCISLESSTIGKSIVSIGSGAFAYAFAPNEAGQVNITLPSSLKGFFGGNIFAYFSNCSYIYRKYNAPDKIIGKLQFGENELNVLENKVTFNGALFTATSINEVIIYCSDEHYNYWNTSDPRDEFTNENPDTIFTFPCQPEGNYID